MLRPQMSDCCFLCIIHEETRSISGAIPQSFFQLTPYNMDGKAKGKHKILPKDTPEGYEERQMPPGKPTLDRSGSHSCVC